MEIVEYISVPTSIIIGLGITHLLRRIARLMQHPGREPIYRVHLVRVAYILFFALLALACLLDLGDTLLEGTEYFASLGPGYPVQAGVIMSLCLVGMRVRDARFHGAFAVFALLSQSYQGVAYLPTPP